MDEPSTTHPPEDRLRAFGLGQLKSAEAEIIAAHLNGCRDCSETMASLEDDTFVSLVRKSPGAHANWPPEMQAPTGSASGLTGAIIALPGLPAELRQHSRYEILEPIGRGGMGDVYKAQHRVMHRTVALKVIRPELVKNATAVERFQREVRAAARLRHGNIVTAYDADQVGNLHFLVMEFVDGVDLGQLVQERGALPVAKACDYIRQAAAGLEHAHQSSMVHRDIKPSNLMLTGAGNIKILDFGLANFLSEVVADEACLKGSANAGGALLAMQQLTQMGTMIGTPDYVAPEQAADASSADIRSDIYSLGCTLSFLLMGRPLFEADSIADKLKAHAGQQPPKLTDARGDIPPNLQQVVDRMLAKDPVDRFQSPAEVEAALDSFTQQGANMSRARRHRPLAVASAVLFPLSLLAGVIIYLAIDTGLVEIDAQGFEPPGARVVLLKDGREYAAFDVEGARAGQKIRAGEYEIRLRGAPDDAQMGVWSKRGNADDWAALLNHDRRAVVLYRGGGLRIQVVRRKPATTGSNVVAGGPLPAPRDSQAEGTTPPSLLPPRIGLLTNPPKLPPSGLPLGVNLIVDSSLEETPVGHLPKGWFAWLDDGPNFKCEVVEGGANGKQCLQISGQGTRGVVFATSIPMDRTKRYALKGRVRIEGEAGSWAVIKLNYFNGSGWLGVDDRVGVATSESDWRLFEKTDLADRHRVATLIVPTCHIEGNGTAWFDDLEVVAYDRDRLPADFDSRHGKDNRIR